MSTSRRSRTSPEVARTKAYYEKYADGWAKTHANSFYHEKEFAVLKKLIPRKARVVDIGCAGGVLVPLFLGIGRGLRYHGIDIARKFISIASRHYPQLPFTQANITDRASLPRAKFDAFILASVLMHLPVAEWDTALSNIEYLNKRGAHGYIVLPSTRPETRLPQEDTRHFTIMSQAEHIAIFKQRGWKILKKFSRRNPKNGNTWEGYIVQLP